MMLKYIILEKLHQFKMPQINIPWEQIGHKVYVEFWWSIHNGIAHPASELIHWFSLWGLITKVDDLGNWLHDVTVPQHDDGEGRG